MFELFATSFVLSLFNRKAASTLCSLHALPFLQHFQIFLIYAYLKTTTFFLYEQIRDGSVYVNLKYPSLRNTTHIHATKLDINPIALLEKLH